MVTLKAFPEGKNLLGLLVAISATLTQSIYQLMVGSLQKSLEITAPQLLFYQSPIAFVMLMLAAPLIEDFQALTSNYNYFGSISAVILGTGALALLVNLSFFFILGKTSPLTYNVIGHSKTIFLFIIGIVLFGDSFSTIQMVGFVMALCGTIWYSQMKSPKIPKEEKKEERPAQKPSDVEDPEEKK